MKLNKIIERWKFVKDENVENNKKSIPSKPYIIILVVFICCPSNDWCDLRINLVMGIEFSMNSGMILVQI